MESIRAWFQRIRHSKPRLAIFTVVIILVGFVATTYSLHLLWFGTTSCASHSSNAPGTAYFSVIMSANGYNDSKILGLPRPVMNVTLGETVFIHVVNNDTTEDHGFTISYYYPGGLILSPGKCYDVTFTANRLGTFTVFCQIFCIPHIPWMQNGELNVNR